MSIKKPSGYVIYDGPSLLDGKPIVAIAITKSKNTKTANMVQTYIIRKDIDPREANKSGADFSICGDCPHRGEVNNDPDRKLAKNRTCYVVIGQGPVIVYKGLQKGIYPEAIGHKAIAKLGEGRMVRIGTYGDGGAVPGYVWESLTSRSKGHTAYSHQSGETGSSYDPDLFMKSVDTFADALKAWGNGERTFRVAASLDDIIKDKEVLCPASEEGGRRTTCEKCGLCGGASVKAKSIVIVAHGAGKRNLAA
jgi:hypothetical protein